MCQLILKKSQHPDRKGGGGGGVNPYPDRKKTVFLRLPLYREVVQRSGSRKLHSGFPSDKVGGGGG